MISVSDLSRWVGELRGNHHVAIGDSGVALYCVERPAAVIVVGCTPDDLLECPNCGATMTESQVKNKFPNIPDLLQRIAPGEKVPYGECLHCGALVHPFDEDGDEA